MKILQVQFQNRNGHTLRGIVTCLIRRARCPLWCICTALPFARATKSMYTHLSRALAPGHRRRPV